MSSYGRSGRGGGSGRGSYYKNKYGGGGGGRGGCGGGNNNQPPPPPSNNNGGPYASLLSHLRSLNNQQYPRYHSIEVAPIGTGWQHQLFNLFVNRTQSDPYARPTNFQLVVPNANLPPHLYETKAKAVAVADFLLRKCHRWTVLNGVEDSPNSGNWGGVKGGDIQIQKPGQMVLESSGITVSNSGMVTMNLSVNLPARGRTILGEKAAEIFGTTIPSLVATCLQYNPADEAWNRPLQNHVDCVTDQIFLRAQLEQTGLVAFVCNGSVLPRSAGDNDGPMVGEDVKPFVSPPSLRVSFTLPSRGVVVEGMGIKRGVNLIVGGGFHGKSTLMSAIQLGVYNKVKGDGREMIVSNYNTVKVKSEEGRRVSNVNISPFINRIPSKPEKYTESFSSNDASGSTSQAASVMESVELGAQVLLFDEDTCANNFMQVSERSERALMKTKILAMNPL